ncbi:hypothetical protein PAV_2c02550 [Paenibacillus alvei DSM 29]|nr:hypothetical protein PAV_2c02550 [Paenibacillus alvei DSM 29]
MHEDACYLLEYLEGVFLLLLAAGNLSLTKSLYGINTLLLEQG